MFAFLMGLPSTSPKDLHSRLGQPGLSVFDVNSPASWQEAHVPGARHLDPEAFGPADLPADQAALLVFYCSNPLCRKAPNAALRARKLGHTNIQVMPAGIKGWLGAGLPVESGA